MAPNGLLILALLSATASWLVGCLRLRRHANHDRPRPHALLEDAQDAAGLLVDGWAVRYHDELALGRLDVFRHAPGVHLHAARGR